MRLQYSCKISNKMNNLEYAHGIMYLFIVVLHIIPPKELLEIQGEYSSKTTSSCLDGQVDAKMFASCNGARSSKVANHLLPRFNRVRFLERSQDCSGRQRDEVYSGNQ